MRGEKARGVVQVNHIATAGQAVRSQGGAQCAGESFADKLKAKKRIIRRSKVPRGKWLCLNDSVFGEHSLLARVQPAIFCLFFTF
jgi:hypothetical protein